MAVTSIRDIPSHGVYFATYEAVARWQNDPQGGWALGLCAAGAPREAGPALLAARERRVPGGGSSGPADRVRVPRGLQVVSPAR